MPSSIEEKRKTISNSRNQILEGRVIANYGDPGLEESLHFDILSRFVIVAIESAYIIPSVDKWWSRFAIVARPEHLWVAAQNGKAATPSSQTRTDFLGNTNVGIPGSYSVNGIPPINQPYELGELIKFKKLPAPITVENSPFFLSAFTDAASSDLVYGSWYNEGATLAYFAGHQDRINALRNKTIYQPSASFPLRYLFKLWKYQYESAILTLAQSDSNMSSYLASIFSNTLPNSDAVYQANGGYVFSEQESVAFESFSYEDVNYAGKFRTTQDTCLPLVISSPSNWPTPKQRTLSTINYSPTYSNIILQ
jgi:hypothetical protein